MPTKPRNQFNTWRAHMGWSVLEASRQLGIHSNTAYKYSNGLLPLTTTVYLAMLALKDGHRLPPE